MKIVKIRRNKQLCHGCRTCEVMCSFHHQGFVGPNGSSIRVTRDNATGGISWKVNNTCDLCREEQTPFCVKYCPYNALEKKK